MAWSNYPISGTFDPRQKTWLQQLYQAVRIRQGVLGQSLFDWPEPPAKAIAANWFSELQTWIDDNAGSFMCTVNDDGTPRSLAENQYLTWSDPYGQHYNKFWDADLIKQKSWVTQTIPNWTAETGSGLIYRKAQVGDLVRARLYNECYYTLSKMIWPTYSMSASGCLWFRWTDMGLGVGDDLLGVSCVRPTAIPVPTDPIRPTQLTPGFSDWWAPADGMAVRDPEGFDWLQTTPTEAYRSTSLKSQRIRIINDGWQGNVYGFWVDQYGMDYPPGHENDPTYDYVPFQIKKNVPIAVPANAVELVVGMFDDLWYNNSHSDVLFIAQWDTLF